jgi:hypothetical protein
MDEWVCSVTSKLSGSSEDKRAQLYEIVTLIESGTFVRSLDRVVVAPSLTIPSPPTSVSLEDIRVALLVKMVELCEEYQEYVLEQQQRKVDVDLDFVHR